MTKHVKCARAKRHLLKMGFLAIVSAVWLVIRTGRKPSRITYPCQKVAAANIHVFLAVLFLPFLDFGRFKSNLFSCVNTQKAKAVVLLSCLLFAFGSIAMVGDYGMAINNTSYVPLNLQSQISLVSTGSSDLFFVQNASEAEGNMDAATVTLLQMMLSKGLHFYKTTDHPDGLIAWNDVVLIKVNCQWPWRGGTNTDLVKSVISRILDHPEGFVGEVVIADNGQGRGSLDWVDSNAYNHSQSMEEVADTFSSHKVSVYLWDPLSARRVDEYSQSDFRDGYVVNLTANPTTNLRVSYPKFKTEFDSYISFKHGIWDNATSAYDSDKLKVINMPVLKSHQIYGVTASVKHYMGVVSQSLTNAHDAIRYGAMGTEMVETNLPTLTILDAIWVNANPIESSSSCGPRTTYSAASYTNIIGASQDPVALDYWSSKHILVPAAIYKNYTSYSSLNPDYEPITPGLAESFHNYLERSMNELKEASYQTTMNETEMNVTIWVSGMLRVPQDLPTIQQAVDASMPAGTISVTSGTYPENVTVWKPLTIKGENTDSTIVERPGAHSVFHVTADDVNISGLTIRGGEIGIWIDTCSLGSVVSTVATNNDDGMRLTRSYGITVSNNTLADNLFAGLYLEASNSTIEYDNMIINNTYGIYLQNSENNSICVNTVSLNGGEAIHIANSVHNTLSGNMISDNNFGIYLEGSNDNTLFHNNFINNTHHVYTTSSINVWDDGYPSGGNYWSNHSDVDLHSGPYQNETGGDGILDAPYIIDPSNMDNFPLTNLYWNPCDLNRDLKVDMKDLGITARAFGSDPASPDWNPQADITGPEDFVPDGKVDMRDVGLVARRFGEIYP